MRDQLVHYLRQSRRPIDITRRDLTNRGRGFFAEMGAQFFEGEVDDIVLAERVKSRLGYWGSHPSAIEIVVEKGRVILSGSILAEEVEGVLRRALSVRGAQSVENRLEVYPQPENVPELQGMGVRRGERPEFRQEYWAPAPRMFVGVLGAFAAWYGLTRWGFLGNLLGVGGLLAVVRVLANQPITGIVGIGAGRRPLIIQKDIEINAPVPRAYALWCDYESFPQVMSHVREVRRIGPDRFHWVVDGPAGVPISWDAVMTRAEPDQLIAWKTESGSPIQHSGIVRFDPTEWGGTRLEVRLAYTPLLGGLGHAGSALLRADPKARMNDDLMRMKSFIETGIRPSDAAAA